MHLISRKVPKCPSSSSVQPSFELSIVLRISSALVTQVSKIFK